VTMAMAELGRELVVARSGQIIRAIPTIPKLPSANSLWPAWMHYRTPSSGLGRLDPHWHPTRLKRPLGLTNSVSKNGWMPTDPREAQGVCGGGDPFIPPLQPWQTGGAGANNIPPAIAWPPPSLSLGGAVALLPSYTAAGPIPTLPGPTFTAAPSVDVGNGWFYAEDDDLMHVPDPSCNYLDPWVGPTAAPPSPLCT